MSYDIKHELDPLMIERMKNCMKQLFEKGFIKNLHDEILISSTLMSIDARQHILSQVASAD